MTGFKNAGVYLFLDCGNDRFKYQLVSVLYAMTGVKGQEAMGAVSVGAGTAVDSRQPRVKELSDTRIVAGRLCHVGQVDDLLRMLPVDGRVMLTGEITEKAVRVLFVRKENIEGRDRYCVDIYMRCNGRCGGKYRRGSHRMEFEEAVDCLCHFAARHGIRDYELLNLEGIEK